MELSNTQQETSEEAIRAEILRIYGPDRAAQIIPCIKDFRAVVFPIESHKLSDHGSRSA